MKSNCMEDLEQARGEPQEMSQQNETKPKCKRTWLWIVGAGVLVLLVVVLMVVITVRFSSSGGSDSAKTKLDGTEGSGDDTGSSSDAINPISFTGVQKLEYSVTVDAVSTDDSCDTYGVQPLVDLTAVCPVGTLTLTAGCRILKDGKTISCERVPSAEIACFAQNADNNDLKLALSVDSSPSQGFYTCRAKTGFSSGFDGYTWVRTYYGGTVHHVISVMPLTCNEAEVAMEATQGSCETSQYRSAWTGTTGHTSCRVEDISPLSLSTSLVSDESCLNPFALDASAGTTCEFNVACVSNACVNGVCAISRLQDNEIGCDDDQDCFSHGCARLSVEETELGCCSSGDSLSDGTRSRVCTQ